MDVKRNWWRIISPCLIASIVVIIGIIDSYADVKSSDGWSILGVIALAPILLTLVVCDIVLKLTIKKTAILWLSEIAAIIITAIVAYS